MGKGVSPRVFVHPRSCEPLPDQEHRRDLLNTLADFAPAEPCSDPYCSQMSHDGTGQMPAFTTPQTSPSRLRARVSYSATVSSGQRYLAAWTGSQCSKASSSPGRHGPPSSRSTPRAGRPREDDECPMGLLDELERDESAKKDES